MANDGYRGDSRRVVPPAHREAGTRVAFWTGARRLGSLVLFAGALVAGPAVAATTDVALTYAITLGGIRIGEVSVNARFIDGGYAISLSGQTRGVSRLVSDAAAAMSARGTIRNGRAYPVEFQLSMREGADGADATMALRDRDVTDLTVVPGLVPWFDLVPLMMEHVQNVVDPMSALFAPVSRADGASGTEACNRTIPVFDGWSRYDLTLTFTGARTMIGPVDSYSGPVFICGATYRPIAGHRSSETPVVYMEGNSRLEAWLMPIAGQPVYVPYQLVIGTELGDLLITIQQIVYAPPA